MNTECLLSGGASWEPSSDGQTNASNKQAGSYTLGVSIRHTLKTPKVDRLGSYAAALANH